MKTKISFVLVAFLILLGCAISDISSAVQPNKPTPKKTQVYITVPFAFTGGTFPNFTFTGPFEINGAFEASGTAIMNATVNINFMVYHCIWTLTDDKGTITLHEQCEMGSTPVKGRWEIVSGTGDYTNLRGNGSALMPDRGDGLNWELLTGVIYSK
jgi:major membrane immunogen (membrane-anchored lipoprotein)